MEPLAARTIHLHIEEMQREAAAARLAAAARRRQVHRRAPRVAVRLVSNGLMFIATRLDPNLGRPSYGRE